VGQAASLPHFSNKRSLPRIFWLLAAEGADHKHPTANVTDEQVRGGTIESRFHTRLTRAVLVSDCNAASCDRALRFGASSTFSADPQELVAGVLESTDGRGADIVLELAGVAPTVEAALTLVRTGGTVLLAGTVAPVGPAAFDPERVVRRMLTIRGVHNYHPRDLATALAFLAGPGREFPWQSLVAAEYPLDQAEEAFAAAHAHPGMRVAVVPSG
jgi:alcohol dehydrogenase